MMGWLLNRIRPCGHPGCSRKSDATNTCRRLVLETPSYAGLVNYSVHIGKHPKDSTKVNSGTVTGRGDTRRGDSMTSSGQEQGEGVMMKVMTLQRLTQQWAASPKCSRVVGTIGMLHVVTTRHVAWIPSNQVLASPK